MALEKLDTCMQKINCFIPYTIQLKKWIIDPNVEPIKPVKTIKLPEENLRDNLCDLGLSDVSLRIIPIAQSIKINHKLGFIKIKKMLLFERHLKRINSH